MAFTLLDRGAGVAVMGLYPEGTEGSGRGYSIPILGVIIPLNKRRG